MHYDIVIDNQVIKLHAWQFDNVLLDLVHIGYEEKCNLSTPMFGFLFISTVSFIYVFVYIIWKNDSKVNLPLCQACKIMDPAIIFLWLINSSNPHHINLLSSVENIGIPYWNWQFLLLMLKVHLHWIYLLPVVC